MREAKPGQGKANLVADLKENHPQAETIYYILPVNNVNPLWVAIASVFHLFPFRTEKLSPIAPMVLQCNAGE